MNNLTRPITAFAARFLGVKKQRPVVVGLGRNRMLEELVENWEEWNPDSKPPVGWQWLYDTARPSACLIRYCNGRLDRITRREWYKARQRMLKQEAINCGKPEAWQPHDED